ncbi:hypothetical protein E2320_021472 [Naja naja]|nr:hypothetical protein E2320_021472 [Naja naja]
MLEQEIEAESRVIEQTIQEIRTPETSRAQSPTTRGDEAESTDREEIRNEQARHDKHDKRIEANTEAGITIRSQTRDPRCGDVWAPPLLPLMESSPEAMIPRETTPLPYLLDRDGDPHEARERRPNLPSDEEVSTAIETLTAAFGLQILLPAFSKTKKAQGNAERSPASNSEGVPRGDLSGAENHSQTTSPKPQRERRGAESSAPHPSMQREAQRDQRSSPAFTEHNSRVRSGASSPVESQAGQWERERQRYNKNNDKDGNYRQNPKRKSNSTNVIEGDKPRLTKLQISQQWLIDSGANNHVVSDKRLFTEEMDSGVKVANGIGERVKGKGDAYIPGLGLIKDILYVPGIDYNLLAALKLSKDGHIDILFSKGKVYVTYDGEKAGEVVEKDGLPYYVPIPSIASCERVKDERTSIREQKLEQKERKKAKQLLNASSGHGDTWTAEIQMVIKEEQYVDEVPSTGFLDFFFSPVMVVLVQDLL